MTEALSNLSQGLARAVDTAGSYLLRIEARRRLPASGIAWSEDGVILTAHHVVRKEEDIRIGLPSGDLAKADLIGRDPTTDVAVLKTKSKLNAPSWADPDALRVGHLVLALGRPGQGAQATLGVISALGDAWQTPPGGHVDRYLQTDVVMYPGFSGGPLINSTGQVIGMNTSALLRGVSVALPTPTLRDVVSTLLEHGHIRRGYLGVGTQAVRLPPGLAEDLDQETALLLISVEPDSPAGRAGLVLGDTIVAYDDRPMRQIDDLLRFLGSGDQVGKEVLLRIVRGGKLQDLTVRIGERK
jgi:S1-C subfamily serine protease